MGARHTEAARDLAVLHGQQLEREVRTAMPAAGIKSVAELARQSRVQRDTLYAWFRGDQPPKPATLQRVAEVLGVRLGDLWNYETHPDGPPPTLTPEVLAEIREAVAEGVALGVARALDATVRVEPSPRRRPPPRQ